MAKNGNKIPLPKLDDLFTVEEERIAQNQEKVVDISLKDIEEFPNHPFKVIVEEDDAILESIKIMGVRTPVLVRPKENGKYELISGHRRKKASEMLGIENIPCIVEELTDDEATILMVDSNLQREHILPSEKAFAYKMKLDSMKRQGFRTDLTSDQVGEKLSSVEKLAKNNPDSKTQIQRYIRLTELIKPLLDIVDEGKIALNPAVEISFLNKEEQKWLLESIEINIATPSLSQAQELKSLSQNNLLTQDVIDEILGEEKANQVEKLKINMDTLRNKIPRTVPESEYLNYIDKALTYYNKHLERQKNNDSR